MREAKTLSRAIEVTAIPYGERIPMQTGTTVYITQSLGGSFTAVTDMGYMVRIDAKDADAIGEQAQASPSAEDMKDKPLDELVWDQLKSCYDPEIPVNIVELGLVYSSTVTPVEGGGNKVAVTFSLTAPGCGMGDVLRGEIQNKIQALPGVTETDVQIAFDPPWDQSRMSDAARLQLGLM